MNKEQIELGLRTGLDLLGPESDVKFAMRQVDGVVMLRQFLIGVLQGHLHIVVNPQAAVQGEPAPGGEAPPPAKVKSKPRENKAT